MDLANVLLWVVGLGAAGILTGMSILKPNHHLVGNILTGVGGILVVVPAYTLILLSRPSVAPVVASVFLVVVLTFSLIEIERHKRFAARGSTPDPFSVSSISVDVINFDGFSPLPSDPRMLPGLIQDAAPRFAGVTVRNDGVDTLTGVVATVQVAGDDCSPSVRWADSHAGEFSLPPFGGVDIPPGESLSMLAAVAYGPINEGRRRYEWHPMRRALDLSKYYYPSSIQLVGGLGVGANVSVRFFSGGASRVVEFLLDLDESQGPVLKLRPNPPSSKA